MNLHQGSLGTRYVKALIMGGGNKTHALAYASGMRGWEDVARHLKTAVGGMTSGNTDFVSPPGLDLLALAGPLEIIGQLTAARHVPFDIQLVAQSAGGGAGWIGEGKPIPVSQQTWGEAVTLARLKVGGIQVISRELAKSSHPNSESALSRDLTGAIVEASDTAFIDPANSGVANVKPAAITYGVPPLASAGSNAAGIAEDSKEIIENFVNGGGDLATSYWIMNPASAAHIAGTIPFPQITARGGMFCGIPVITSKHVPRTGSPFVSPISLVDASRVWVADGQIEFDVADHATIEMTDAPTGDASDGTQGVTSLVSMWQTHSTALKSIRTLNFKAAAGAVAVLVAGY